MPTTRREPIEIFISFAQADDILRVQLENHLAGLVHDGMLRTWHRQHVMVGDAPRERIDEHMAKAQMVLLLVSASYLANDLCDVEMKAAVARAKAGAAQVIPVILRACEWRISMLAGLQPLPKSEVPITSVPIPDEAWAEVVRGIRKAVESHIAPLGRSVSTTVTPEPAYESAEFRILSERLSRAYERKRALDEMGAEVDAINLEILDLRRGLRDGGQLRAGDALGDGRYLLLRVIGQGGFGVVWGAYDRERNERVAIKVLHPTLAREPSRRERFFRGARVMADLNLGGVVRVLERKCSDGGYLYFVMEQVDGADLHRTVLGKQLSRDNVVPLILRVSDTLSEAHAKGIVHRDVKPANILLNASGVPKLTDFDLVWAKNTTGGTADPMGSFLFAAPEQLQPTKKVDARADVYALGMMAMFCFHGEELPPSALRRPDKVIEGLDCSAAVKEVLTKAIALEPEERYPNASAFSSALRNALAPPGTSDNLIPSAFIPDPFVPGPPLSPERSETRSVFRGRRDIVHLIEHDIASERGGVLVLFGQRRIGKTSLRNWLAVHLDGRISVIVSDLQMLSAHADRETPHRLILEAIAAHAPPAPKPPDSPHWGEGLDWLKTLDKTLTDRGILVVIDEVERLQDGIREGWCTPDFLDFLRAAGDSLRRIRFLLLTAYPLHRLGDHWVDRLISATSRSISYLDEKDARELMVAPIPDFPDIYPEGGVDRILAETARHPYLLQKVGDELTRLLNARGNRKATQADLEKVFDSVIHGADLFDELWRQRTPEERAALRRLAASSEPLPPDEAALGLVREGYVERKDGKVAITVPLFREWIIDTKGTGQPE